MSSFEIASPQTAEFSRELSVINTNRLESNEEFAKLCDSLITDKNAFYISSAGLYSQTETYISPFKADDSKKLIVSKKVFLEPREDGRDEAETTMGVTDIDFDMSFSVLDGDFLKYNLSQDPYVQLILNYFREQYSENKVTATLKSELSTELTQNQEATIVE